MNQGPKLFGFVVQSNSKITLQNHKTTKFGLFINIERSQSNFNLRSSYYDFVLSYLITTVIEVSDLKNTERKKKGQLNYISWNVCGRKATS